MKKLTILRTMVPLALGFCAFGVQVSRGAELNAKPSPMQPTRFTYFESYDLKDSGESSRQWHSNGLPITDQTGFTVNNSTGGSLVFKQNFSEDARQYEVAATLNLIASGGDYVIYLEASSDALLGSSSSGSFYAFAIQNPTFSPHGCFASATLYKAVMGMVSRIASASIPCSKEMTYHAVFGKDNSLRLWVDNTEYLKWSDAAALVGAAGIGGANMPTGNSISFVQLGRRAQYAPVPPQPLNINVTGSSGGFGLSIGNFIDDSGPGVAHYYWYRNGAYLTSTLLPRVIDFNAPNGVEYIYTVQAEDFHGNVSPLVTLTDPTRESFSVMRQADMTCPLGQVYDEENFSPVDGSGPIVPPQLCILPGDFSAPQNPTNHDTPPLPACTIVAHFRTVNTTGGSFAGHGYLTLYSSGTHQTSILEGYTPDGKILKAWDSPVGLEADKPETDPIVGRVPTSTVACTYAGGTLGTAIDKINKAPPITYKYLGPNSNSVWRYLISQLPGFQGTAGFPPFSAIGYSSKIPGVE